MSASDGMEIFGALRVCFWGRDSYYSLCNAALATNTRAVPLALVCSVTRATVALAGRLTRAFLTST